MNFARPNCQETNPITYKCMQSLLNAQCYQHSYASQLCIQQLSQPPISSSFPIFFSHSLLSLYQEIPQL